MKKGDVKVIAATVLFMSFFFMLWGIISIDVLYVNYNGLNNSQPIDQGNATTQLLSSGLNISSGFTISPAPVCKSSGGLDAVIAPVFCAFSYAAWLVQFAGVSINVWWLAPIFITVTALVIYVMARLIRGGG